MILIDCPPSLGLLTLNGLVAATSILVPLQCEFFALEGLSHLAQTVDRVRASLNPRASIDGIVLTMYDRRNNLSELVAADARSVLWQRVYREAIPRSVRVSEAPSHGKPVILYDRRSAGAEAYLRVARELEQSMNLPSPWRRSSEGGSPALAGGSPRLLGEAATSGPSHGDAGLTAVDDLEPNPFQPRAAIDEEELAELATSIREQGLLQPILIRRHPARAGTFQIIAGERRWRAARLAGLTRIPTFLRDLPDHAASAAALVENLQRQDLNPIEEAEGFKRLIEDFGLTQDDLAKAIGKSRSHVANPVRLLHLPAEVIEHVRDGTLSAGHARAALASTDPTAAAKAMIDRGLDVRQAEALASRTEATGRQTASQPEQAQPTCARSRRILRHTSGLRCRSASTAKAARISLRYQTLDQLDHIVQRARAAHDGSAANAEPAADLRRWRAAGWRSQSRAMRLACMPVGLPNGTAKRFQRRRAPALDILQKREPDVGYSGGVERDTPPRHSVHCR